MVTERAGLLAIGLKFGVLLFVSLGLSTAAHAACLPKDSQLPQETIQQFLAKPSELLSSNPTGGNGLQNMVQLLVSSENETLPAVIKLLASANPQQRDSIGKALAAAAKTCLGTDQAFAGQIQVALIASGDKVALTAFVSGGGQDAATAAISAGAPADTAYVSGAGQVTGNSSFTNTGPTANPNGGSGGGGNLFTFIPSSGSNGGSRGSTAQSTSPSR